MEAPQALVASVNLNYSNKVIIQLIRSILNVVDFSLNPNSSSSSIQPNYGSCSSTTNGRRRRQISGGGTGGGIGGGGGGTLGTCTSSLSCTLYNGTAAGSCGSGSTSGTCCISKLHFFFTNNNFSTQLSVIMF